MKKFSVIAISLLLVSASQLVAQRPEPPEAVSDPFGDTGGDPFGADGDVRPRAKPSDRPSVSERTPKSADQPGKRAISHASDLFAPVCTASLASSSRQRIERALDRETTFDYLDQPLKDVIEDISFMQQIPMAIDVKALEELHQAIAITGVAHNQLAM